MAKPQRIRDPVHDLIEFGDSDLDQVAWRVLDSFEMQRLRRIKQLGFSDFVFPGATHSRFAHSIGVFHTARKLTRLIRSRLGDDFDDSRAFITQIAALVHDVGHGPFSHSFEGAMSRLGHEKKHEAWTSEIVAGDSDLSKILNSVDSDLSSEVADLLLRDTPTDIYSSVVSSQFDADRLDYMQRDRLMTGAQHGAFDLSWLIANLEVDRVVMSTDGEAFGEVDSLILGNKALQAAEAYVLGLFHLYFAVYFHKTTRSAEKMFSAFLERVGQLIAENSVSQTGLSETNPIVMFFRDSSLRNYLNLNDYVVWASLESAQSAADQSIAEISSRLVRRELYKCIDVLALVGEGDADASVANFRARLNDIKVQLEPYDLLEDSAKRDPYKRRGFDSPEALSKVLIRRPDGSRYVDLASRSNAVAALKPRSIFRVYTRNQDIRKRLCRELREIIG